jgi:hypothetical protein
MVEENKIDVDMSSAHNKVDVVEKEAPWTPYYSLPLKEQVAYALRFVESGALHCALGIGCPSLMPEEFVKATKAAIVAEVDKLDVGDEDGARVDFHEILNANLQGGMPGHSEDWAAPKTPIKSRNEYLDRYSGALNYRCIYLGFYIKYEHDVCSRAFD